jgi:hypothetical protein
VTVYSYSVTSEGGQFKGYLEAPRGTRIERVRTAVMQMVAKAAFMSGIPLDPFNAGIIIRRVPKYKPTT